MPSTQTDLTREIVIQYFTALQARNLNQITSLFADTIDWYIPGNETLAPWLGKRTRKDHIAAFYTLLWSQTEPISGNIDHMLVEGNVALTSGLFVARMRQTNKLYESIFFTEITVNNGLIVKYRLLEEGYGLVKALTL